MLVASVPEVRASEYLILMNITPVMGVQPPERAELSRTEHAIVPAIIVSCEFRCVLPRIAVAATIARIPDETIRVGDNIVTIHPYDEFAKLRCGETGGTTAVFDVEHRSGDGDELLAATGAAKAGNSGDLV